MYIVHAAYKHCTYSTLHTHIPSLLLCLHSSPVGRRQVALNDMYVRKRQIEDPPLAQMFTCTRSNKAAHGGSNHLHGHSVHAQSSIGDKAYMSHISVVLRTAYIETSLWYILTCTMRRLPKRTVCSTVLFYVSVSQIWHYTWGELSCAYACHSPH